MFRAILILFCHVIFIQRVEAGAACCAGKGDFPSLITDHSRSQYSLSAVASTIIGSSNENGNSEFFHSDKYERSFILNGSVTTRLSEEFQIGVNFPFVIKDTRDLNRKSKSQGIGDPSISIAYEIIDHHSQSLPQTLLVLSASLPAGTSHHESEEAIPSSAVGSGHWALQTGLISFYSWENWSTSAQALAQYSFPQDFDSKRGKVKVAPGWNTSGKIRIGYSLWHKRLFLGLGLGPRWQEAQTQKDIFGKSKTGHRLAWDASAELNLLLTDASSLAITYLDQTLVGPTRRSPLSRSLSLGFQIRN